MTIWCVVGVVLAFLVGVGGTVVVWAACSVSGATAEDNADLQER